MKLLYEGGKVRAEAEDAAEVAAIVEFAERHSKNALPKMHRSKEELKKRRKHSAINALCTNCGGRFRGLIGLGIHRRKEHGIPSPYRSKKSLTGSLGNLTSGN